MGKLMTWWTWLFPNGVGTRSMLVGLLCSALVTVGVLSLYAVLFLKLDDGQRDVAVLCIQALLSAATLAVGYYFGSRDSSAAVIPRPAPKPPAE